MDNEKIIRRFLTELLNRKMSKADFCNISGIGQNTISNLIKRGSSPSVETLIAMADTFNVTTDYMLCRTDKICDDSTITAEEMDLINAYREADEIDKRIIKNTLHLNDNIY